LDRLPERSVGVERTNRAADLIRDALRAFPPSFPAEEHAMFPSPAALRAARLAKFASRLRPLQLRWALPLLVFAAYAAATPATALAIEIVAIDEYWELNVGEPDSQRSAPQITMVTSPVGSLDGLYFLFALNHQSHPEWAPGGMQVQLWNGSELVASHTSQEDESLHHADETVRWVQRTELKNGQLSFKIDDGESDSWGSFGGDGLKFSFESDLSNLNGYLPAVPIAESGVSFAGNRVRSLTLMKLRWTDSNGQVYELNAPIDVDADLDP
jgi:hypothetical protein